MSWSVLFSNQSVGVTFPKPSGDRRISRICIKSGLNQELTGRFPISPHRQPKHLRRLLPWWPEKHGRWRWKDKEKRERGRRDQRGQGEDEDDDGEEQSGTNTRVFMFDISRGRRDDQNLHPHVWQTGWTRMTQTQRTDSAGQTGADMWQEACSGWDGVRGTFTFSWTDVFHRTVFTRFTWRFEEVNIYSVEIREVEGNDIYWKVDQWGGLCARVCAWNSTRLNYTDSESVNEVVLWRRRGGCTLLTYVTPPLPPPPWRREEASSSGWRRMSGVWSPPTLNRSRSVYTLSWYCRGALQTPTFMDTDDWWVRGCGLFMQNQESILFSKPLKSLENMDPEKSFNVLGAEMKEFLILSLWPPTAARLSSWGQLGSSVSGVACLRST